MRLTFILHLLLASIAGLIAQPAVVPQLQAPTFNSQDLDPFLNQARGSQTQGAWEAIVQGGLAGLRANWEATVTAQINAELLNVTQSDAVNNPIDYQNYVRSALQGQMSSAEATWTSAAQNIIQTERQTFLASLSAADLQQAEQDAKAQTEALLHAATAGQTSDVFKTAAQTVADAKALYEKGFNAQLESGLQQFSAAQGALDQNFNSFLAGLNQTEQDYQQNLQSIQAAEGNVRNAISAQVQGMQNYLQSSQMFYNTTCDAQGNNCVSNMNQAGTDLLTVITNLQTALQQNAPLSQLTQTMVTYLAAQENVAYTTEQTWLSQVHNDYDNSALLGFGGNWGTLYLDPQFNNVRAYIDGNPQPLLDQLGGPGKTVTISSIQLQGYSASHNPPYPIVFNVWETNHIYLPNDGFPFQWGANGAICFIICFPQGGQYSEDSVIKTLTYHVYDSIAESNAQTWGGYKNDLNGALASFTALQQSIDTWEVQVSQYQAQHAAWLAGAQQDLIAEQQAYDAASTQITAAQNTWLEQMNDAHRAADAKWQTALLNLSAAESATRTADQKAQQDAAKAVLASLPSYSSIQQPNMASLISIVSSVPSNSSYADASAKSGLPNFGLIENLESKFTATLGGLSNFAIAKTASDEAENMKSEAVRNMVTTAKAQADALALSIAHPEWTQAQISAEVNKNMAAGTVSDASIKVTTDASGRTKLTRMVANGQAALNDGGDATNAEAYHAVLAEQTIYIAPPPTQKLANEGSLFKEWNLQSIVDAQDEYRKQTQKSMDDASKAMDAANDVVSINLNNFHKEAQRQAAQASQIKSLLTALLTGGTVESWVQGQVRGQIADAISAATGFPAGFLSGLMGGMKPHQAAASYAESLAYQHLGEAIGSADLASMLQTQLSQAEAKRAKTKAGQLHVEDLLTGGATYMMRNASYNPTLAKVDKFVSAVPGVGAAWQINKSMYQATLDGKGIGGAIQAGINGVVNVVKNVGDAVGSMLRGDIRAAAARGMAAMTGISTDKLMKDFGAARKPDLIDKAGAYTGLDVLAKDLKIATQVYGSMAMKVANTIQTNTIKGAADLSGNNALKEKMKMKADMDYATASDFTKNLGFGARGGIMSLAFTTGNPFVVVGSAILMANDKVFSRIEKGLVATYAQYPVLMDATTGVIGGGAYTMWKVREGWVKGGDKGALVAAGNLAIQAVTAGMASGAIDVGSGQLASLVEHMSGSMSYTREGGFSANLGVADFGGKLGGGLSYSDRNGLGISLNAGDSNGLSGSVGFSARGGLSVSGNYGQKGGPAIGMSYDSANGFGVNISRNFEGDGGIMPNGFGVSAGLSQRGGINASVRYNGDADSRYGQSGVGLTYSRGWDGKDSLSISMSRNNVSVGSLTDRGVATINPTLLHDYAQAFKQAEDQAKLAEKNRDRIDKMDPAERRRLMESLGLDPALGFSALKPEERDAVLDAEHAARIKKDIEEGKALDTSGMNASRGDGIMDDFLGDIQDGWYAMTGGGVADKWGYFDSQGQYASRNCFAANEPVWTLNGIVRIQDVKSGDSVLSYDEKAGRLMESRVNEIFVRTTDRLIHVHYGDRVVRTTPSHPFYIAGLGWIPAGKLRAGLRSPTIAAIARHNRRLAMSGGYRLEVSFTDVSSASASPLLPKELPGSEEITAVEVVMGEETVYNFTVQGQHDYFVGENMVLVHNVEYSQNAIAYFNAQTRITHKGLEYEKKTRVEDGRTITYFQAYDEIEGTFFTLEMTDDKRGIAQNEWLPNAEGNRSETRIAGSRAQDVRVGLADDPGSDDYITYMDESVLGEDTFEPEKPKPVAQKPAAQPAKDDGLTAEKILAKVNEWGPLGLASKAIDWLKSSILPPGSTQDPKKMTLSIRGSETLKGSEAVMFGEEGVYIDVAGNPTAGVGVLIPGVTKKYPPTKEGAALFKADYPELGKYYMERTATPEKALELYAERKVEYVNAVKSKVTTPLTQAQFDAMVSLTYNIGPGGGIDNFLMDSKLNSKLANDTTIYNAFKKNVWAGGKVEPGLIKRRIEEYHLFKDGDYNFNAANTKEMQQWCTDYKVTHALCVAK